MGAAQVIAAITEWVVSAVKHDPLLVAPTLVIVAGVFGLAVFEALIIANQVATTLIHHYRNRLAELRTAVRGFGEALGLKRKTQFNADLGLELTRPRVVQRDRLAQQDLFHREPGTKTSRESA